MRSGDAVLAQLAGLRATDAPSRGGRTLAYVYEAGLPDLDDVATRAYAEYATVNALDMTVFPSVVRLENDVVTFVARLLGGSDTSRGTFTSGGTESIMLAVKAARDRLRATRAVPEPEMVVPSTAHAAFGKAAAYLGVRLVTVPVDPVTFRAVPAAIEAAITERTALVVVSAPSYAHGVVDPVREIAEIAAQQGVLCHVDACVGGMILPYFRRLGRDVPDFDLSVPGVTSLTVDLHKYGFADKGASVVLYADTELRRHQYFACAAWPGYPVVNATVQGSKPAGLLAAAWAVIERIGDDGYLRLADLTRRATEDVAAGIAEIPGLRVLGAPDACLLAVTAEDCEPLHIADEMRVRGWYVQPQLSFAGLPRNLHLTITPVTARQVEPMLADLAAAVHAARALPSPEPDPALRDMATSLDPDALTAEEMAQVLAFVGLGDGTGLPTRMAPVLALLDAAPPRLKERFLTEFIGSLFTA